MVIISLKKILSKKYYILSFLIILFMVYWFYFLLIKKIDDSNSILKEVNFIGHGAYGINNTTYTNSVEALNLGYDSGIRIMEVDFLFTSDGKLVLNHYWEDNFINTYNSFLNNKVKENYTSMDIEMLLSYMSEYEDLYIIIDTKENEYDNGKTVLNVYEEIVNKTKEYDEGLLDRFIVQLYNFDDLKEVNKVYKFENKMFTMYKLGEVFNIYKIVYYCLYNDIESIVMPYSHIYWNLVDEDDIKFIRSKNINVYINTINDEELYKELLDMGISGVYTDFLS